MSEGENREQAGARGERVGTGKEQAEGRGKQGNMQEAVSQPARQHKDKMPKGFAAVGKSFQ